MLVAEVQISPVLSVQITPHVFFSLIRARFLFSCCGSPCKPKKRWNLLFIIPVMRAGAIVCNPETAMIHCLALASDQPLNNVYHCLPRLFNYLPNIIDKSETVPMLRRLRK